MSRRSTRPVNGPESLDEPQAILDALAGQNVLAARASYGDELHLHFGRPTPHRMPRLAGWPRGEWILATRASPWRLEGPSDPTALINSQVVRAELTFPDLELRVTFDNTSTFAIPVNQKDDDLAAWELFTPDATVLTAGPGRCWSLLPADSPVED